MLASPLVIPESAQRLSGTHNHRSNLMTPRVWVPVFRFAETGMTRGGAR